MNPNISIIIPIYNVELYLKRCLDSVVNQTLENIEIICVNDGSTDNSLNILNEYAQKDSRIKIFNQNNSGVGVARNKGLKKAKGEFVLFVDSDDWIDLNTCEILYNKSKKLNLDLLLYNVESFDNNNNQYFKEDYYKNHFLPETYYNQVFNNEDIKEYIFTLNVIPYCKLYKRSLLEKYDIRFPENIYFEDNPFHWECLLASNRISAIKDYFSLRRRRDKSITADIDNKFLDVIKISSLIVDVFNKYDYADLYEKELINFKIEYIKRWFYLIEKNYKSNYWKLMKNDFLKIYNNLELHEKFLNNLTINNKNFYCDTIKSQNYKDLIKLNELSNRLYEIEKLQKNVEKKQNELNINKEIFEKEKNIFSNKIIEEKKKLSEYKNLYHSEKEFITQLKDNELNYIETKQKEFDCFINQQKDFLEKYQIDLIDSVNQKNKELNIHENEYSKKINELLQRIDEYSQTQKQLTDEYTQTQKQMIDEYTLTQKQKADEYSRIQKQKADQYLNLEITKLNDTRKKLEDEEKEINDEIEKKEMMLNLITREYHSISENFMFKLFSRIDKKPYISIIIPVYNTEDYLAECLDSVINQSLFNIEIICINDGSTDNSLNILNKYAEIDKRIKVITQKNQGLGSTRNNGLDIVTGEYVMFLDADDWLSKDACKILYKNVKSNKLDMLLFLIKNYSEKDGYYEDDYYNLSCIPNDFVNKTFNYHDLGKTLFQISISSCQKIYKTELIKNIRFPENILFEDNPFYWECIFSAKKIGLIREHLYLRRRHSTSITAKYNQNYLDVIPISKMVFNVFEKYDAINEFKSELANHTINYISRWYGNMMDEYKEDYWIQMKKYFKEIHDNEQFNKLIIENTTPNNKNFYLNVLKTNNSYEFDYSLKKWNYKM